MFFKNLMVKIKKNDGCMSFMYVIVDYKGLIIWYCNQFGKGNSG